MKLHVGRFSSRGVVLNAERGTRAAELTLARLILCAFLTSVVLPTALEASPHIYLDFGHDGDPWTVENSCPDDTCTAEIVVFLGGNYPACSLIFVLNFDCRKIEGPDKITTGVY